MIYLNILLVSKRQVLSGISILSGIKLKITASTASTTTKNTFNDLSRLKVSLRDPANAGGLEVLAGSLDTTEATKVLVTLLTPLGNQICIGVALSNTIIIQFSYIIGLN